MEAEIGTGRLYAAGNFAASVVLWFATKYSNNKRFCTATILNCIQNRPQRRVDTFNMKVPNWPSPCNNTGPKNKRKSPEFFRTTALCLKTVTVTNSVLTLNVRSTDRTLRIDSTALPPQNRSKFDIWLRHRLLCTCAASSLWSLELETTPARY